MAPFGRKFLKARSKSRSDGKDADPGKEIQVWVRQEEKVVCGLTKHTTCAEVVQALLDDQGTPTDSERVPPTGYCLLERWRGFERALPPLTRVLRLWTAWGEEQASVQFALVRSRPEDSAPGSAAGDRSRGPAQHARSLPADRQKRMVRKAFRKLEKIRERERAPSPGDDGRICDLVRLVIAQDRALREQADRMRELDAEIERAGLGLADPQGADRRPLPTSDPADGLGHLERQLERHRDLVDRLSRDIDAELRAACSAGEGAAGGGPGPEGPDSPEGPADSAELERVRRDLEHSMYRGLTLRSQLAELERELRLNEAVLGSKGEECRGLAAQLGALGVADRAGPAGGPGPAPAVRTELRKVLPHGDGTDTDSDTGISSTHSQDSLSPCGPPLETQV